MNRWVAGNVIWPLTERLLGRDTLRRFGELQRTDRASADELAAIQECKLRRLLLLVGQHCRFYRERFRDAGLDVGDPQLGLTTLGRLPFITRDTIRDHLTEMSWTDCPGGPARPYNTGGSTGQPLQFYFDRCRQAADWAARSCARGWWHIRPGDREIMVWAGPVLRTPYDRLRVLRDRWLNQHILDAFNMTEETMNSYADCIRRMRPVLLYGYASSLALLARRMLERGDILPGDQSPRAVFVTGETVTPRDARDIQSAFAAPAVIEYGARDCGLMANACPAGRLHVNQENVIIEVIDENGLPVAPGEVGEVVVTSLESFATPIIRYRVGDLAQVAPTDAGDADGRCACGRFSQQLLEIRGRITDQIVCPQGGTFRRMHALSLIYVLREADGLRQFRIVQNSLHDLEIEVVADERFTPAVQQQVLRGIQARMGSDVAIQIIRRDRIPPTASGKHPCVVSHVTAEDLDPVVPLSRQMAAAAASPR